MINAKNAPPIMKGVDCMPKYAVRITETLEREVEVEANDGFDALRKVEGLYYDEKIVLDAGNLTDREFTLIED